MRLRQAVIELILANTGPFLSVCQANPRVHLPNQPISFKGKVFNKNRDIAQKFCRQFTSTVVHKSDPQARRVKRSLGKKHKINTSYKPFTSADTRKAISVSKCSSAVGPDGLTAVYLKHIGPRGLAYLTHLFNLSVSNADLPAI
jgi:hypothetical protein